MDTSDLFGCRGLKVLATAIEYAGLTPRQREIQEIHLQEQQDAKRSDAEKRRQEFDSMMDEIQSTARICPHCNRKYQYSTWTSLELHLSKKHGLEFHSTFQIVKHLNEHAQSLEAKGRS
jgi:hypothetical protein